MKRVEYFLKEIAEREAALVVSPTSGQGGDRPTPRDRIRFDSAQPRTTVCWWRSDCHAEPNTRREDTHYARSPGTARDKDA
jgi:hypothetical protein